MEFYLDSKGLSEGGLPLSGPALICRNNAIFTETDFESLQSLGGSLKKGNLTKIGKFGIGINSVYHLCDRFGFVSADSMCMLDPQGTCLSSGDSVCRGRRWKLQDIINDDKKCRDLALFDIPSNTGAFVNETIFRFPLRTCKEAENSELSENAVDLPMIAALFKQFFAEEEASAKSLMFLNNVRSIQFYTLGKEKRLLYEMKTVFDKDVTQIRDSYPLRVEKMMKEKVGITSKIYYGNFSITRGSDSRIVQYLFAQESGSAYCVAKHLGVDVEKVRKLRFVPDILIAVNLSALRSKETAVGGVACFLPLIIENLLPVNIHATFGITQDRRSFIQGSDLKGEALYCSQWNEYIFEKLLPRAFVAIQKALSKERIADKLYEFFPRLNAGSLYYGRLASNFFMEIGDAPIFWSHLVNKYVSAKDGVVADTALPAGILDLAKLAKVPLVSIPTTLNNFRSLFLAFSAEFLASRLVAIEPECFALMEVLKLPQYLEVLDYLFSYNWNSQTSQLLEKLRLIYLSNGTYARIRFYRSIHPLIVAGDQARALFPNCDRFVNPTLDGICNKIFAGTFRDITRLSTDKATMRLLIEDVEQKSINPKWCLLMFQFLKTTSHIIDVSNHAIIPTRKNKFIRPDKNSKILVSCPRSPSFLVDVLESNGYNFLHADFDLTHFAQRDLIFLYIENLNLYSCLARITASHVIVLSGQYYDLLRSYIFEELRVMRNRKVSTLRDLPLFVNNNNERSLAKDKLYPPKYDAYIPQMLRSKFLKLDRSEYLSAIQSNFDLWALSEIVYWNQYIIANFDAFADKEKKKLSINMMEFLNSTSSYYGKKSASRHEMLSRVSNIRFIMTEGGVFKLPAEMLISTPTLRKIFSNDDIFPNNVYEFVSSLHAVGVRSSVSVVDLLAKLKTFQENDDLTDSQFDCILAIYEELESLDFKPMPEVVHLLPNTKKRLIISKNLYMRDLAEIPSEIQDQILHEGFKRLCHVFNMQTVSHFILSNEDPEDFFPSENLCTRIKDIMCDYPDAYASMKEVVQNAEVK